MSLAKATARISHLYKSNILSVLTKCKDVLADRDWLVVWQATGLCPLSLNARLVHAYLRRKRKATTAPNFTTIASGTGINRDRGVPKAVRELLAHGLVVKEGGGFRPVDPGDRHAGWFAMQRDGKRPKFFRVYVLTSTSKLTDKTNALYWLMVNLDSQRLADGSRLRRNTKSGLSSMLGVTRETVHDGLKLLTSLKLFTEDEGGLHVHPPADPYQWKRRQGVLKGSMPGQDLWSKEPWAEKIAESWEDIDADDEFRSYLWDALAESWDLLRSAGYWQSDAKKFLEYVRANVQDIHHALFYLRGTLPQQLSQADAYHVRKRGHYRCSLYALKALARRRGSLAALPRTANH